MDCIWIKGLEVFGNHGVMKEENILGQKFRITIGMYGNFKKAGQNDNIIDSVHYGEVAGLVKKITEENTFQLIETLGENLAKNILLSYPLLEKVQVEVEKPWAPVMLPLDTVSVEITRQWNRVFLGLGSNMGDKKNHLEQAIMFIKEWDDTRILKMSSWIETLPVGEVEQDNFLNGVVEIETLQSPEELLESIWEVEKKLKRKREQHWGPRTIDVDILLYNDLICDTKDLIIPHCEMNRREFVLEPMCEIAPYKVHPITRKTMKESLEILRNTCFS